MFVHFHCSWISGPGNKPAQQTSVCLSILWTLEKLGYLRGYDCLSGFEVCGEVLMERTDFVWPCNMNVLIVSSGNENDIEGEAFMLVNRSNK